MATEIDIHADIHTATHTDMFTDVHTNVDVATKRTSVPSFAKPTVPERSKSRSRDGTGDTATIVTRPRFAACWPRVCTLAAGLFKHPFTLLYTYTQIGTATELDIDRPTDINLVLDLGIDPEQIQILIQT